MPPWVGTGIVGAMMASERIEAGRSERDNQQQNYKALTDWTVYI